MSNVDPFEDCNSIFHTNFALFFSSFFIVKSNNQKQLYSTLKKRKLVQNDQRERNRVSEQDKC